MGAGLVDSDPLVGGGVPDEDAGAGLLQAPSGVGFDAVGLAGEGAEVVGPGLVGQAWLVRDRVVQVQEA